MVSSQKKIGIIIVSVLALMVIVSFLLMVIAYYSSGTSSAENFTGVKSSSFSSNGVSFEYPSSWTISVEKTGNSNMILASENEISPFSSAPFQVQITPNYGISEEAQEAQMVTTVNPPGWSKVSNGTMTIAGQNAHVEVFDVNSIWPPMWNVKRKP